MKIAACVILFNPDESIIQNIKSYIKYVHKLYVIDNSENININLEKDFNSLPSTIFMHDGFNSGIAKRLNQACDLAIENGFDCLLTMDQDSFFDESSIKKYFECIETIKENNVSMFGINYRQKPNEFNCNYMETKFLITSGSIINLKSYKKIGLFDENLFIDFVDTEYCFRSIEKDFKIIEFSNIYMHHNIGKSLEKYSLKTLKKTCRSFHSATRIYYMVRNFLYVNKIYKQHFDAELKILKRDILNRIKNKMLYEKNRITTLKFLLKAFKDFNKNKMGKLN